MAAVRFFHKIIMVRQLKLILIDKSRNNEIVKPWFLSTQDTSNPHHTAITAIVNNKNELLRFIKFLYYPKNAANCQIKSHIFNKRALLILCNALTTPGLSQTDRDRP